MRRLLGIVTAIGLALSMTLAAAPAAFAETAGWAQWEPLSGSAGNYTTTMQVPAGGFPAATVRSDSRGGVGVISGASTWLSEDTPPGTTYGTSRDQQYLNLRPRADRADTPSTTTYTFERPTPAGGWAFVLGDIDADEVTVTAKGPDGQPLDVAELGFQEEFNYCDATGGPSCTGADLPSWDPATATLTGNDDAIDTSGASGWFEPTAPIKTLTFTFAWRQGFPVYQTWFASLAREIAGTVTVPEDDDAPMPGATVTLFGPDGSELATTTTADDGTYSFPDYTAADGYEVEITPPTGYVIDETAGEAGQERRPADLGDADDLDIDFALRAIVPAEVNGTVTDDEGNPLAGVQVALTGSGPPIFAVTDSDGFYVFDRVEPGNYQFGIVEPDGYTTIDTPAPIIVPPDSEEPLEDNDFVLAELPTVSGTVTAGDSPVPNVTVTIDTPDGPRSTVTGPDGTYEFPGLEAGDYTVVIEVPGGYEVDGSTEQDVTVEDDDVTDVDFALFRPGEVGGLVLDEDGNPVPGATILVEGPDGEVATVTTDEEGSYYQGDLPPGDYTVTITPPDGYTVDGESTQTATITEAGESRLDVDFGLTQDEPPGGDEGGDDSGAEDGGESGADDGSDSGTDDGSEAGGDSGDDNGTATGDDDGTASGGEDGTDDELPDTGTPLAPLVGIAILLLALGAVATTRRASDSA